jgi:oligoendopeptidase F
MPVERSEVRERAEIAPAHRWSLEDLFETPADWEREFARVERLLTEVAARAGTLSAGPDALAAGLRLHAELGSGLDRVYLYAHLRRDEDTREPEPQAMAERAARLASRAAEATSFLEPEILAIPGETLEAWRDGDELAEWRHYLDDLLRTKEHTLSPREEEILAMAGELARVPRTAFGMLNDADLTFRPVRDEQGREVELTKGRYSTFLESTDRRVRADAWESMTESYEAQRNTVAALLAGAVKRDVFFSRVRRYESSLHAALHASNIPTAVYHTLVETIDRRRAVVHRAGELRRRVLGLDRLKVYDLYVPLGMSEPPRYGWDEAVAILREGLRPLGADYVSVLERGLAGGWIDVHETRGKRSGAYSWGTHGHHPYVLMNWQGTLDHLFTLAHEMGHALHSHWTNETQPYHYSHYPIFLAEVASTTNEAILMDHLLKTTEDPDRRLALLNQYIDQIRGTVVTQVMFADFEHRIHVMAERGEPLTVESIGAVYAEIFRRILGPAVDFDERSMLGWARIPHFYTGYYVYQYATGYAAATALSRRILAGGDRERDDYLGFLKAGDSDYPIDILRRAGVDLATPDPVNDTLDLFESLLDQLEKHLEKHGSAPVGGG